MTEDRRDPLICKAIESFKKSFVPGGKSKPAVEETEEAAEEAPKAEAKPKKASKKAK